MQNHEEWNEIYKKRFNGMFYPREAIVKFFSRYVKRRTGLALFDIRKELGKALDVGCGNGRHVKFLLEQDIDAYGIDISQEAISIGNAWLQNSGLKSNLSVGNALDMDFEDGSFDLIISDGVLDHLSAQNAKKAVDGIYRVLDDKGYFFLKLRSTLDSKANRGQEIEKNTRILADGYEKGEIQQFFDQQAIDELLYQFKIFDISLTIDKFPDFFGIDKAFIQSSTGNKHFINDIKEIDMTLQYADWFIAAEKR